MPIQAGYISKQRTTKLKRKETRMSCTDTRVIHIFDYIPSPTAFAWPPFLASGVENALPVLEVPSLVKGRWGLQIQICIFTVYRCHYATTLIHHTSSRYLQQQEAKIDWFDGTILDYTDYNSSLHFPLLYSVSIFCCILLLLLTLEMNPQKSPIAWTWMFHFPQMNEFIYGQVDCSLPTSPCP